MQPKRILITFLIVIPIIFGLLLSPVTHSTIPSRDDSISSSGSLETNEVSKNNYYAISQDTQEGILNPNRIIQRGYQETNLVRARTDSNKNTLQNITIDNENDWAVSKAEVEVTNLRKIYAVNGTFDEEVDPWVGTTYDPSGGDQEQYATWNSTEGYVTCINYGEFTDKPVQDDTYTHYLDSEILWEQTVSNSPQTTNFSLSFRYRYVSGPVDPEPYDFSGDVQLWIYVHSDIYWMSIATGDLRGVWYSLTDYPIELVGAPTSFTVGIGLHIEYANLVLTENGDYDDDGYPDGLINAQKIEVNLDDFEFKSQTPIPFEDVDLTFNIGSSTASIIGPTGGVGTSIISNPSLWVVDPLQIEVTANNSVSFDYFVTSYFQRDFNSSWTTDLSENGVLFQIEPDQNADLEYYTYIIPNSDYENLTLEVQYPSDWENTTILDPLRNDITGLCTVSAGCIFVPNSLFSRVGWWKITQQAYNYAKEITIQILDDDLWTENSLFRPNNSTRVVRKSRQ